MHSKRIVAGVLSAITILAGSPAFVNFAQAYSIAPDNGSSSLSPPNNAGPWMPFENFFKTLNSDVIEINPITGGTVPATLTGGINPQEMIQQSYAWLYGKISTGISDGLINAEAWYGNAAGKIRIALKGLF